MHQLNNLDIIILIVVGISALIAFSRGLVKEVLSIIGWVLATIAIVYLLPLLNPVIAPYISSGVVAGIVSSLIILISFMVFWILSTGQLVDKVRSSKLGNMDRTLGLFFGIARACLLVILFNIMVGWIIPKDQQSDVLTKSKYFTLAGNFAQPIERLIPEDTLNEIRKRATSNAASDEDVEKAKKEKSQTDELFEKLARPKIKKKENKEPNKEIKKEAKAKTQKLESKPKPIIKEKVETIKPTEPEGYNKNERQSMDSLIDDIH